VEGVCGPACTPNTEACTGAGECCSGKCKGGTWWSLVFRRMLFPAISTILSLAAPPLAAADVSQKLLVERTARVVALLFRVPPPATVLLGSSAKCLMRLVACVLWLLRCVPSPSQGPPRQIAKVYMVWCWMDVRKAA
jgi:hypothetical protein